MKFEPYLIATLLAGLVNAAGQVPPNDQFGDRISLAGSDFSLTASNRGATREPGEPLIMNLAGGRSVWWSWTAPLAAKVVIDLSGSDFDTLLAVDEGKTFGALNLKAQDHNSGGDGKTSKVTFNAVAGNDYDIVVDGYQGAAGTIRLRLRCITVPEIVTQPHDFVVTERYNVTNAVVVLGYEPLAYQWQFSDPNIGSISHLARQTNAILDLRAVALAQAGLYRVVISNIYGSTNSDWVTLTVNQAPLVTQQPQSQTVEAGSSANFSTGAVGSNPLYYQWFFNGNLLPGATNNVLSINDARSVNQGGYQTVVSNFAGSATSQVAQLVVITHAPAITKQPTNLLVAAGDPAAFMAQASGSPLLSCQWFFQSPLPAQTNDALVLNEANATPLSGQTTNTLVLPVVSTNDAGLYELRVTNDYGQANSRPARLTVVVRPPNDNFADRSNFPLSVGVPAAGWNNYATHEPYEPNHAGVYPTTNSVWWYWQNTTNVLGLATLDLAGSSFDTVLGIYQGSSLRTLSLVASNVNSGPGLRWSKVSFVAEPDAEYAIAVDGVRGAQGTIQLFLSYDTNITSPIITLPPSDCVLFGLPFGAGAGCEGVTLSVNAVSLVKPLAYQWLFRSQSDTNTIINLAAATNNTFRVDGATPANEGYYAVVVSNPPTAGSGSTPSRWAHLELRTTPGLITITPPSSSVREGATVVFRSSARGCPPLTNQWRFNGTDIPGATRADLTLTEVTPLQTGSYDVVISNPGGATNGVPAQLTVEGRPIIKTQPKGRMARDGEYVADLQVVVDSYVKLSPLYYQWQFNGTNLVGATNAANTFNASLEVAGNYQVVVSNRWGAVTSAVARITVDATPKILTQPGDQRLKVGDAFQLDCKVDSYSAVAFQWQYEGTAIMPDTNHAISTMLTNSSLKVVGAQTNDAGRYLVKVSNAITGVTSRVATVQVIEPPGNDMFTNRYLIMGTNVTTNGHNQFATNEPGEPNHARKPGGKSVWWTWTAPEPGTNTIDLSGSKNLSGNGFDTLLGIYTGLSVDALTEVAFDDQGGSDGRTSKVTFPVEKGVAYQIAVDGNNREEGFILLRLKFDQLISPPVIVQPPKSQAASLGSTVSFTVVSKGSPRILFQWQFNGVDMPGETNATLKLANLKDGQEGNYTVVLTNPYGTVTSQKAQLTYGAIITGMVTDATNGRPIPDAKVSAGDVTTYTDDGGNYALVGVKPGFIYADFDVDKRLVKLCELVQFRNQSTAIAVILTCTHAFYFDYVNDQIEVPSGQTILLSFSMSPQINGMRFVLNWGLNPADLDGYLLTPAIGGTNYLINYLRRGSTNSAPYAILDHDVTTSYGPETITINAFYPGTYHYFVKKYNVNAVGDFPTSGATVKLYDSNGLYGSRKVPTIGNGRFWYVCDIVVDGNGTNVVWINRLQDVQPMSLPGQELPTTPVAKLEADSRDGSAPGGLAPLADAARPVPTAQLASLGAFTRTNYLWDFGDGTTSTNIEPVHVYAVPGRFTVRLDMTYVAGSRTNQDSRTKPRLVTVLNAAPEVAITYPNSNQLFRAGTTIPIRITAIDPDPCGNIVKVELFESGRPVVSFTQPPYEFKWTNAAVGSYLFQAQATDNVGTNTLSSQVPIKVLDLAGDILIVRNFPDPEIDQLTNYLSRDVLIYDTQQKGWRNVITKVLDQEGLWYHLVETFKVIIWHDLGDYVHGLSDNDVAVFQQAFTNGISLYFIGETLTASTQNLTEPQRSQWLDLTHLASAGSPQAGAPVQFTNIFPSHPLVDWNFGLVTNFNYPAPLEFNQPHDTNAEVVAVCGPSAVMLAYPPFGNENTQHVRTVTQDFRVFDSGGSDSLDARRRLFLNSVYWLLYMDCPLANLWIEAKVYTTNASDGLVLLSSSAPVRPLEPLIYKLTVMNNMECAPSGVVVTNQLPALVRFESAFTPKGFWLYDTHANQVIFHLFRLAQAEPCELTITTTALRPGTVTNTATLSANYVLEMKTYSAVNVITAPTPAQQPLLTIDRLAGNGYRFSLIGQPGCSYTILNSADLAQWVVWTNFFSANTTNSFLDTIPAGASQRWYKAVSP